MLFLNWRRFYLRWWSLTWELKSPAPKSWVAAHTWWLLAFNSQYKLEKICESTEKQIVVDCRNQKTEGRKLPTSQRSLLTLCSLSPPPVLIVKRQWRTCCNSIAVTIWNVWRSARNVTLTNCSRATRLVDQKCKIESFGDLCLQQQGIIV
jgi:hypothetical protein